MKQKVLVGILVVVASGVLTGGLYYWWLITPPGMPQTVDDAASLLKSARFQRLSKDRKFAYVSHIRSLYESLDGESRKQMNNKYKDDEALSAAMRKMGEQFIYDRARAFAMASPIERQLLLDTFIGTMERHNSNRKPRTEEQEQHRKERRAREADRMNNRAATGNPQHQSYLGEFVKSVQKRRDELGLAPINPDQ